VDEGDVVVGADDVAEGGEALFYPLDFYGVGDGVAEVLEFLVGGCGGDEEAFAVAWRSFAVSMWLCMRVREWSCAHPLLIGR